jgi:thiamine-monophosphate kinase
LLGGDTVAGAGPRQIGLTAIGEVDSGAAPSRAGAQPGDLLCVTGIIGAAGLGLQLLTRHSREGGNDESMLIAAYRRPQPRLAEGRLLAPLVHAMADISDGLLIDAARIATASGIAVHVDLDRIPLSPGAPDDRAARVAAATAGDDYELIFAWPAALTLPKPGETRITIVGAFHQGKGLTLSDKGATVEPPTRLGYEHGTS